MFGEGVVEGSRKKKGGGGAVVELRAKLLGARAVYSAPLTQLHLTHKSALLSGLDNKLLFNLN
jgi:hypothetical protein